MARPDCAHTARGMIVHIVAADRVLIHHASMFVETPHFCTPAVFKGVVVGDVRGDVMGGVGMQSMGRMRVRIQQASAKQGQTQHRRNRLAGSLAPDPSPTCQGHNDHIVCAIMAIA